MRSTTMNRLVAYIALTALAVQVSGTKFEDCGSTPGLVYSVEVAECPDSSDICILQKGGTQSITINFISKGASDTAKAVVHGIIGGMAFPFPIKNSDVCQSDIPCPIEYGESYTYTNQFPIRKSYPPVSVIVRWEIQDDNGDDLICVEIPCEIQ